MKYKQEPLLLSIIKQQTNIHYHLYTFIIICYIQYNRTSSSYAFKSFYSATCYIKFIYFFGDWFLRGGDTLILMRSPPPRPTCVPPSGWCSKIWYGFDVSVTTFLPPATLFECEYCIGDDEVTGVDELLLLLFLLFTILFAPLVACSGDVETRVRPMLPLLIAIEDDTWIGKVVLGMGVLIIEGAATVEEWVGGVE